MAARPEKAVAETSQGFPAVAGADARILILGSLPGERSIARQQYYAHPRNAFWPIMEALFAVHGAYVERLQQLVDKRIALWDVLRSSVRPGSMDASIRLESACANDFETFLGVHRDVRLIAFNGRKAEQLFNKLQRRLEPGRTIARRVLPSTSPAYAALPYSAKLDAWRDALQQIEQ